MTTRDTSTRDFDIIVFGATSFAGSLTARYLDRTYPDLKLAIAGRSAEKLAALGIDRPQIVADASSEEDMRELASRTRVIITTVGPYTRYGAKILAACVEAGTDSVDLCGEAGFIRRSIDTHHATAQETGARIVHSCGFDSIPSDIGMLTLSEAARADNPEVTFERTTMVVAKLKGGMSGGTIESMRVSFADDLAREISADQYCLNPDPSQEPKLDDQKDLGVTETPEGWAGPFFMAPFNTRVVRRSNALLNYRYGKRMRYTERVKTGSKAAAYALAAAVAAGFKLANTKGPWQRLLPAPGEGPSAEKQAAGHFTTIHHGITTEGEHYTATVHGDEDPGYAGTAKFLGEAAMTLLADASRVPGGIHTPASGLGMPYAQRLRDAGFSITTKRV